MPMMILSLKTTLDYSDRLSPFIPDHGGEPKVNCTGNGYSINQCLQIAKAAVSVLGHWTHVLSWRPFLSSQEPPLVYLKDESDYRMWLSFHEYLALCHTPQHTEG